MHILTVSDAGALVICHIFIFCVRLLQVCSFSYDGQYQSLDEWTSDKYGSHALYF